jgi:hypothetical protein
MFKSGKYTNIYSCQIIFLLGEIKFNFFSLHATINNSTNHPDRPSPVPTIIQQFNNFKPCICQIKIWVWLPLVSRPVL